ncbi:MAG: Rieske (2Fe-2S) protein [Solirubrobacterales bacterium]
MATRRAPTPLQPLIDKIESFEGIDEPAKALSWKVSETLGPGAFKDALSGTAIGHALHPMLTDVVIGSFLSSTALDVIGGEDSHVASERLIALGIAAYPPTALTGMSDWADGSVANTSVRRVGMVHAAANSAALALYTASLFARRRGKHGTGAALGFLGAGALGFAGYLGGHLTLVSGVGVDQTVFDAGPSDWTEAADAADLVEGEPVRVVVEDTPVLLLRRAERTFALHDRCNHRGCSLVGRGEVSGDEIECRCHGSRFALEDGSLLQGPATQPQPAFETRERDGKVELRALHS